MNHLIRIYVVANSTILTFGTKYQCYFIIIWDTVLHGRILFNHALDTVLNICL